MSQNTYYVYHHVLEEVVKLGVKEFCICPGSRNSPLVICLMNSPNLVKYGWYEERSAAFFALGRARQTKQPVAVVTTSGSAVGELLPAAMEAHYLGVPLLLITADRPRRFRRTGAPQSAEQEGIFGPYAHFAQDLEQNELCDIKNWDLSGPAHLNVCLEEPNSYPLQSQEVALIPQSSVIRKYEKGESELLSIFFKNSKSPLVVVSALQKRDREAVVTFLQKLNAPIYCESGSGLREKKQLLHLQIRVESAIWSLSERNNYKIDGILRIGGVPVTRVWRDLEDRSGRLAECSLSEVPFSGLSWGSHITCQLHEFLPKFLIPSDWQCCNFSGWLQEDRERIDKIHKLFQEFPTSEPALFFFLSKKIPKNSMVYLGNSLPIREWDLAASYSSRGIGVETSRGVNGIDGQLSTFLGLCDGSRDNWAIVGDLTALYDFPALWILQTLSDMPVKIVVINNGGGKIFAKMYKDPVFQHLHAFDFEHFAKSWKIPYFRCCGKVMDKEIPWQAFIEICPDSLATEAFWRAYNAL